MANWCDTQISAIGNEKEINELYNLMVKLENMKETCRQKTASALLGLVALLKPLAQVGRKYLAVANGLALS